MLPNSDPQRRREILRGLRGDEQAIEELLTYTQNRFDAGRLPPPPVLPLPEEAHVADWRNYAASAGADVFASLQHRLPQLSIPVRAGISATAAYAEVMRRGQPFDAAAFGGRLVLERSRELQLVVYEHDAGALPVLLTPHRRDFELLTCALVYRNEPRPINPSVNAQMIAGLLNWDRARSHRRELVRAQGWPIDGPQMERVAREEKWRFYDRLILSCVHPYSDVAAGQLHGDMQALDWASRSTVLRLEHEFTHYATMRLYHHMALNLFDELICDWAGMTAAVGRFDAAWFRLFLGLEAWPRVRPTGRIHAYRQDLSDGAFELLACLVVHAAEWLEALNSRHYDPPQRRRFFLALTQLTLEELACEERFQECYAWAGRQLEGEPARRA